MKAIVLKIQPRFFFAIEVGNRKRELMCHLNACNFDIADLAQYDLVEIGHVEETRAV